IVGFCGETEQQFEGTRRLYEEIEWDMAYLARYSPRRGTTSFAAWEDDVSREEKARRWHVLNEVLERCSIRYNESLIGKTLEVLVEKYNEETGECEGKSRENIVVQFPGNPDMIGELVESKITKALTWSVKGAEVGI
ncbi:TRAM domain-containing protein, partial [Patescibacteria group bacterium]|nr:TRAM domain-containing protein [Patescibacteria group bacterium]